MSPDATWLPFLLLLAVDISLWTCGLILDVTADSRFRLLTAAALLLYVVLGMAIGYAWGSVIWFGGLWIYAVLVGMGKSPSV